METLHQAPDADHREPSPERRRDAATRTRRGFVSALLAAVASALIIALLWLISRGAPSAGRDPAWPPTGADPAP